MRDKGVWPLNPELMKEYLLTAFPNPERKGCPGSDTLQGLAQRHLPLSDTAMHHVASCSECYRDYLNYRLDMEEGQGQTAPAQVESLSSHAPGPILAPLRTERRATAPLLAIAASLVIVVTGAVGYRHLHSGAQPSQTASVTPIKASVDLFDATTLRGAGDDPNPLQEVTLPKAVVRLSIVLPRFSQSGEYTILVSRDRTGKQIVAKGSGMASEPQGKVGVDVTLDLRGAAPGAYFLATVRGSDDGTYYYPLKVQ